MKSSDANDEIGSMGRRPPSTAGGAIGIDFGLGILEKLGRLEAKIDMIVGNGQPGRMKLVEDRLVALERNDLRRTIYDRLITAVITFAISAIISWHDHLGFK